MNLHTFTRELRELGVLLFFPGRNEILLSTLLRIVAIELLAWHSEGIDTRRHLMSDLEFDIRNRLRAHDIRNA